MTVAPIQQQKKKKWSTIFLIKWIRKQNITSESHRNTHTHLKLVEKNKYEDNYNNNNNINIINNNNNNNNTHTHTRTRKELDEKKSNKKKTSTIEDKLNNSGIFWNAMKITHQQQHRQHTVEHSQRERERQC